MINAGISRGENSKYSGNGGYTAESTGINKAIIQDSYDPMIQLSDNSLINTDIAISDGYRSGTDSSDEIYSMAYKNDDSGIDDRHASPQRDQDAVSNHNNDNIILTIQHGTTHHDNDSYFVVQPAFEEEPSLHDPSSDILSNNENTNDKNT